MKILRLILFVFLAACTGKNSEYYQESEGNDVVVNNEIEVSADVVDSIESLKTTSQVLSEKESVDKKEYRGKPDLPMSAAPQEFYIGTKDTLLITQKGSRIYIPEKCFTAAESKKVSLHIREAFTKKEMLMNGLQTINNDKLLIANGMIEIRAWIDGKPVEIARGKNIMIELPHKNIAKEYKIFDGDWEDNKMNWANPREISREMLPIPMKYLSPRSLVFAGYSKPLFDKIQHDKDTYENTYIATAQFGERFVAIAGIRDGQIMSDALDFYLNNLKKPLWEVDLAIYNFLNTLKSSEYGFLTEDDIVHYQHYTQKFRNFSEERLTYVKSRLSDRDSALINRYIQSNGSDAIVANIVFNSFSVSRLGWYNIDKFLLVEGIRGNRQKATIDTVLKSTRVFLILKNYNSVLEGYQKADGREFSFSKESKSLIILPIGEPALVVAIGIDDQEQIHLAFEEFIIDKNPRPVSLKMENTGSSDMEKVIQEKLKI